MANINPLERSVGGGGESDLGLRGEEAAGHPVDVLGVEVDADVVEAHLVDAERRVLGGAHVALAGEGGEGDGVPQVTVGQVVTDGSVHVALRTTNEPSTETRRSSWVHA